MFSSVIVKYFAQSILGSLGEKLIHIQQGTAAGLNYGHFLSVDNKYNTLNMRKEAWPNETTDLA